MATSFVLQGLATLSVPGPVFLAPFFATEFDLSRVQVGFLFGVSSVAGAAVVVVAGILADRGRSRALLVLGPGVSAVGFVGLGFAGNYGSALACLAVAGVGAGLSLPAVARLILTTFTRTRRGTAMSIKQTAAPLFPALATAVFAPLAASGSWRLIPTILGIGMALVGIGVALALRLPPREADRSGRISASRRKPVIMLWLVAFLNGFVQLSLLSYFVLWLQDVLALEFLLAAAYLALLQFTAAFSRPVLGFLSDRPFAGGRLRLLRWLASCAAALFVAAALLPPAAAPPVIVALVFLLGISVLGWQGVFQAALVETADRASAGQATGAAFTAVYAGQIAGGPLFGLLVDTSGGYTAAWAALAGASAIAAALLLMAQLSEAPVAHPLPTSLA